MSRVSRACPREVNLKVKTSQFGFARFNITAFFCKYPNLNDGNPFSIRTSSFEDLTMGHWVMTYELIINTDPMFLSCFVFGKGSIGGRGWLRRNTKRSWGINKPG